MEKPRPILITDELQKAVNMLCPGKLIKAESWGDFIYFTLVNGQEEVILSIPKPE